MNISSDFPPPYPVQFVGSRLAAWLLKAMGWQLRYAGFPARQGVVIVYPHTSNWDFPVMLLAKWAVGISVRFWGKDSLFRKPVLGAWMRWLGGIPLDRSSPKGAVASMLDLFAHAPEDGSLLWLGLSPEGTRRRTDGWRSGFYRVALGADVPLCLIALDYARKTISITDFIRLSGDETKDYARMAKVFEGVQGRRPQLASPVQALSQRENPHLT